jgi:3-oxoadipate enol-lactonase
VTTVELHAEVTGRPDGPALLLGGPIGSTLSIWDSALPALAGRFRVIRYDHRGHGRSPVPPGPYSIDDLGTDVLALLDRLGVERAHYCGASMGGMVGLWLAAHAPDRIDRLVGCNTSARLGPPQMWADRAAAVTADGTGAIVDAALARWYTPDFAAARPDVLEHTRTMIESIPPAGYAGCCAVIEHMDLVPVLGRITAPTLVIAGTDDPSTPPEHGEQIAAGVPGARLVVLPGVAHMAIVQQPDAVTGLVADHLAGAAGPARPAGPPGPVAAGGPDDR